LNTGTPLGPLTLSYDWTYDFYINTINGLQGWQIIHGSLSPQGVNFQLPCVPPTICDSPYSAVRQTIPINGATTLREVRGITNLDGMGPLGPLSGYSVTVNDYSVCAGLWWGGCSVNNASNPPTAVGNWTGAVTITISAGTNGNGSNGQITGVRLSGSGTNPFLVAIADANLLANGNFTGSLSPWQTWNSNVNTIYDTLNIARNTGSADGGFYQLTPSMPTILANSPLELTLQLGNSSGVSKSVNILLKTNDWTPYGQIGSCTFTLPPNTPLRTYTMRLKTNQIWYGAMVQGWLVQADGVMALQVDNAVLQYKPGINVTSTTCNGVAIANTNLIANGDFSVDMIGWQFLNISGIPINGVLNLFQNYPLTDPRVFFQTLMTSANPNMPFELNMQLGNSSSQPFTFSMVLRNPNWVDTKTCYFTIPANSPLQTYTLQMKTTVAWSQMIVQGYLTGSNASTILWTDNVNLQYKPSLNIITPNPVCLPLPPTPTPTRTPTYTPTPTPTGGICTGGMPQRGNVQGQPNCPQPPTGTYYVACSVPTANVRNYPSGFIYTETPASPPNPSQTPGSYVSQIDGRVRMVLTAGTVVTVYETRIATDGVYWARISSSYDFYAGDSLWIRMRNLDNNSDILVQGTPAATDCQAINFNINVTPVPTPTFQATNSGAFIAPGCVPGNHCPLVTNPNATPIQIVSFVLACEAGSAAIAPYSIEARNDALAIAHVIFNRMRSLTYGGTAVQVVTRGGYVGSNLVAQWQCYLDGANPSLGLNNLAAIDPVIIQIATELVNNQEPVATPFDQSIDNLGLYTFGVSGSDAILTSTPNAVSYLLSPYCGNYLQQALQIYLAIAPFGSRGNATVFFSSPQFCVFP
jgi:hypothetical protein